MGIATMPIAVRSQRSSVVASPRSVSHSPLVSQRLLLLLCLQHLFTTRAQALNRDLAHYVRARPLPAPPTRVLAHDTTPPHVARARARSRPLPPVRSPTTRFPPVAPQARQLVYALRMPTTDQRIAALRGFGDAARRQFVPRE